MSLTLNLGKVSVSSSSLAASTVEFGGKSYTVATGTSVGLGDNGSLSLASDVLTFVAGEGFSGPLNTSGAAKGATLKAVDFSNAGGAVTFDAKDTDVVTITGSDYNDKLLSNIDGASIDGGEGDDTITFSGKTTVGATIAGGKGDDKISVTEMATVSINDAAGDDTYVISGKGANVTIDDTKGSDNVKISGAGVNADITLAGSDDNIVLLDSVASITANISVGSGDDVITSKSSNATLDIKAGDGDNVITVAGKESEVSITAGKGDDVIDIAKGADKSTVAISVGAGDDIVKINAASVTGSVDGGANDDVLVIAGANAELTVSAVETVNLTGKNGKVSVTGGTVNSSAVGATINAATVNVSDGTAVLDNDAAIKELTISKGSVTANTVVTATVTGGTFVSKNDTATDTILINGSGAVVDAGAGVDTITVSEDATGTNTLTLGDGADTVSIDAGNSKVVITDLGIDDKLTLVDASEETTATLSKTGVLNVVDAGQFNVTANVYTGDVATGADYAADIKNKAKNNVYHASVTAGDAGIIDLYTAAGTTKKVTVDASTVSAKKTIIDLTAAKSSEVTVDGTEATTIALGNGKDVVTVSGTMNGKTEISGYNFANKDVISVDPSAVVLLDKDGKLTVNVTEEDDETGVFVTTTANNNVYAAKVNSTDYYTAKTGAVKIATDKNVTLNTIDVAAAASSNINIAAGAATILALSEGADVINVAAGATVDASEAVYDYADGDVINLGKATIAGAALTTLETTDGDVIGKLTVNNVVTVGASALNDSLYAAKVVSNNNKKTNTYATAVEDASVAIDLSASSFGDVVFDGTNATDVNVAIGAGDIAILSEGEDVITVNGLTKNTKDGVAVSNFDLEADKLVLSNVKLADLTVDTVNVAASLVEINYGNKKPAANVAVDVGTISDKYVSININDTDVKAAIAGSATLTLNDDSKDAFFIGKDDTTLEVSDDIENTVIDLSDTNKYNNIHAVEVTEDATGISIIGTGNKKVEDSIDASANVNGVQVSLGAGNADSVTLSAGADVVWFDAKQGKGNVITNFTYGTGENADVLNLSDVSSLDKVKFTTGGALTVKDGSASANIAFVTVAPEEGASEIVKVQLSDGKIYNVAMDVINADNSVTLNLDDEIKVDSYVGKNVAVVLSSEDEVAYTYAKSSKEDVVAIDGSNTNGAMTIVGVENVTLGTSEEENANKVWAQGTATITATAAAGNDQVWFQSGVDKKVFVTGFADYSEDNDVNDNIKLVGTKSVADIVSQYKLASKDDNVVITGVSSAASKLTVENTSTVVLTDDNGVSYVAKVGEKGDSDDFSTDVQIYAGMTELSSSNIEDDTVILLDGGSSTTFALNSDYYIGSSVTKFDAAGSTGNLVIVGGKTTKNELIGGEGDDLIYGGGASNDTMKGGEGSNTFFYGANDGKDVIENITDEDTINLYSGNLVDLGYNEDKDAYIFTFEGGNTLTVNGDLAEGTMVQYAGATFVYQKDDHTFIQA